MPVNKSARRRHELIDECFRNTLHHWTKKKLLEKVNEKLLIEFGDQATISHSQIRYDIEAMISEYSAPIIKINSGRDIYYKYEDPAFSIHNLPLSDQDVDLLKQAVFLLGQLKGFTISTSIEDVVQRLENKIKLRSENANSVVSFENPPVVDGADNLEDLFHAILRKNVLKITYKAFKHPEPKDIIIHPYLLKEFNHRWFLLGYSEDISKLGVYALDRIKKIKVVSTQYKPCIDVDLKTYFKDVIGVTVKQGEPVEVIILKFNSDRAPYVITKPIHHSQEILQKHEDGSISISLKLIVNNELVSRILSFGKDVYVQQPDSLAQVLRNEAESLVRLYI